MPPVTITRHQIQKLDVRPSSDFADPSVLRRPLKQTQSPTLGTFLGPLVWGANNLPIKKSYAGYTVFPGIAIWP
jgi:hypothetical protein